MMPQSAPRWIVEHWESEIKSNPHYKLLSDWLFKDGDIYKKDGRIKRIKQLQFERTGGK